MEEHKKTRNNCRTTVGLQKHAKVLCKGGA